MFGGIDRALKPEGPVLCVCLGYKSEGVEQVISLDEPLLRRCVVALAVGGQEPESGHRGGLDGFHDVAAVVCMTAAFADLVPASHLATAEGSAR